MKKRPDNKTLEISVPPIPLTSDTERQNGSPQTPAAAASSSAPENPLGATAIINRRTGTVARLPKPVRDEINQLLDDGLSYPQLIRQLGASGKTLDPDHIRRWKSGGYQDYLRE